VVDVRQSLDVYLEPFPLPVGEFYSLDTGACEFVYNPEYLGTDGAFPISLSLPFKKEPYTDLLTRSFFNNLLQENNQLQSIIESKGLDPSDVVGLLALLGSDCPGAISCVPKDDPPIKIPGNLSTDYDPLEKELLIDIVYRLARGRPLPKGVQDPSPLSGVQNKIAVVILPTGQFGLPKKGLRVPTTHFIKVPKVEESYDVLTETASAGLADTCSLPVSIPEAIEVGSEKAVLISRFDRVISNKKVFRIHQEDFGQALGLSSRLKYERRGEVGRRFDVEAIVRVLKCTSSPAPFLILFLKSIFFNLAIGNNDNHAKNYALVYYSGASPMFAPLYDMLPMRLKGDVTKELAFNIGDAAFPFDVTKDDMATLFKQFGLSASAAKRFIKNEIKPMLQMLEKQSASLKKPHLKNFDDLIGHCLEELSNSLEIEFPIRDRDYIPHLDEE
jgi:serine/threonine-protein kinase HipA